MKLFFTALAVGYFWKQTSARSVETTAVPVDSTVGALVAYSYQFETSCEAVSLCTLETKEECEVAAAQLNLADTTAHSVVNTNVPAGCYVRNDNLKFNTEFDSTVIAKNGIGVLCRACPRTTTEGVGPYIAITSGRCDDIEDFCFIETAEGCEDAAAQFSRSDTTAGIQSLEDKVPGCYATKTQRLVFNDVSSSNAELSNSQEGFCQRCPTTSVPEITTVFAPPYYAVNGGKCTYEPGFCNIDSRTTCMAASDALGFSDTTISESGRTDTTRFPKGCFLNNRGNLRLNYNTETIAEAELDEVVLCIDCASTPAPPPVYAMPSSTKCGLVEGLCPIQTRDECEEAAASLDLDDTRLGKSIFNEKRVQGCSLRDGGLRFNTYFQSEVGADVEQNEFPVCKECSFVDDYFMSYGGRCTDFVNICDIEVQSECESAASILGLDDTRSGAAQSSPKFPSGCYYNSRMKLRFNNHEGEVAASDEQVLCKVCSKRRLSVNEASNTQGNADIVVDTHVK